MKETIIQFGTGNFLRGFADYFIDVLNEKGLYDGKVVIVKPTDRGSTADFEKQNCVYNLYLRGIENGEEVCARREIHSVSRVVEPYSSFESYLELAHNPDFRFIISNTTEAGIEFDANCKFEDKPALSFPAKVTQLLFERFSAGLDGFVFLPCELIDNNADALKACILKYVDLWGLGAEFNNWVTEKNTFCNTLVDRIVTGYPAAEAQKLFDEIGYDDKLLDTAEIFHLWVIEGDFENELPLKKAGFNVVWTDNAKSYKKIKVRILNGAHTSLVACALLSGIETVSEAMNDETASAFLSKCMTEEILPTIDKNDESTAFASSVFDRFKNPFIQHKWRSIALNSVSKFSVRVLPTLLEYKEQNSAYPKCLTLALAALIYFYKNDEPNDAVNVVLTMKNDSIADILGNTSLWQADLADMTEIITEYYNKIDTLGAKETMKWILSQ